MPNTQVKHVLIVDDEPNVASVLSASLAEIGQYHCEVAHNGAEALTKLQQTPFALLITDYQMPGMNGLELAQLARQISPNTQVVLMTGYGTERLRQTAGQMDIDGYIDKPFTLQQIREIVKRAVGYTSQPEIKTEFEKQKVDQTILASLKLLQANTGARCILLLSSAGYPVQVVGPTKELDVVSVSALVAANFLAAAELANLLSNNRSIFKSSYHEGDDYNIYAYKINEQFLLAVIFGSESKPGVIWFYTKQAAAILARAVPDQSLKVTFTDPIDTFLDTEFDKLLSSEDRTE